MHHPSAALISRYASGGLPIGPSVVVAAHLEGCEHCALQAERIEEEEGGLIRATAGVSLQADALERALEQLDIVAPPSAPVRAYIDDVALPEMVADIGLKPRRWLWPGLWVAHLATPRVDNWRTFLIQLPAGAASPQHGHSGMEYVAVLHGVLKDDVVYEAGDFLENLESTRHQFTAAGDWPCTCLVSTQGPLKWRGVGRLIGLTLDV